MAKLAWILCTNLPIRPRNLGIPIVFFGAQGSGLCRSRTVSYPADLFINHLLFLLSAPTAACNGQMYPRHQSPTSEGDDQASLSHFFFLCVEWTVIPEVFKNDLNPEKKMYSMNCHCSTQTTETYLNHTSYVLVAGWESVCISSNMVKTKQRAYWHDKCESFCLKLLAVTCSWLL